MGTVAPMPGNSPAERKSNSLLRKVYWAFAIFFAGVLLFFSLRGIDWRQVWLTIRGANVWLLLLSMLTLTCSLFLRALRWRVLLQTKSKISVAVAFWATSVGYFGNSFLPARAGELLRTLWVSKVTGLSRMFVLTTALSERLCDAVALVLISSLILLSLSTKPGWFARAATPFAVIGISGVVVIAVLPRLKGLLRKLLRISRLSTNLQERAIGVIDHILAGMKSFHDSRRLLAFCLLTAVIWLCDAAGTVLGMRALHLPGTLPIALLLITALGLGSALPSTPGYVGIYQFVAVSVLTPFGFSKTDAIAYILLAQAFQYLHISFWGGMALLRSRSLNLISEA